MNMFSALARGYRNQLATRPVPTKIVTSGILFGLGDVIAQKFTGYHDMIRMRSDDSQY